MAMELEIVIPENWNDVTLEQYLKYYKSVKPYEGLDEFGSKMVENAIYHLCGVEADLLNRLPMDSFLQICDDMKTLLNSSKTQELALSFVIGDTKYGFITNIDQMTYGEYVDLVTYSKDVYENAALMCSILYRPILEERKDKYTIADYKGTDKDQIELFYKKITMDVVFGALSFFLRLQNDLVTSTLTSTTETIKTILKNPTSTAAQILVENGVSTQQLQLLQEMIQQGSMQSQD
jgi:hypothetical protein